MSTFTDELLSKHGLKPADVYLPAGGVGVFGRTGSGKSTMFFFSRFLQRVFCADTGSLAHKLWAGDDRFVQIDPTAKESPIDQVMKGVEQCRAEGWLWLMDSWTTLQECQVAWFKKDNRGRDFVSVKDHGAIVGRFRDLALILAQAQGFVTFNTSAGGRGKNPDGTEVVYPAGCVTGYPSLNGTNANGETILARWGTVWGAFAGSEKAGMPRGLYVPSRDPRPEDHAKYAPLKDPLGVVKETAEGKGIMAFPDRDDPKNRNRCFADELLVLASANWPRRRPAAPAPAPSDNGAAATPPAEPARRGR